MSLIPLLIQTKQASKLLAALPHSERQQLLLDLAQSLRTHSADILAANQIDLQALDPHDPMRDRLLLTEDRIQSMAAECEAVAQLPDPIGQEYDQRQKGDVHIWRRRVPFGVIGVIYESRPNVTIDVASLCLKSGNAVVLKGGKEANHSNQALVKLVQEVLLAHHLPEAGVSLLDPAQRDRVKELLTAREYVDLLIPRGGAGLIKFVREHATVPCIETGAGVCHLFVDEDADVERSVPVILNAKIQRPSVCNALDTLLIHQKITEQLLPLLAPGLQEKSVEVFADQVSFELLQPIYPANLLQHASPEDFGREFLSLKLALKVVPNIQAALEHISHFSSQHSESILSQNKQHQELFLSAVDAAAVYVNASTRFTDGGQFGLGCEVGISTQKMHARGPMGLEALTTYKWLARGDYSIRSA